MSQARPIIFHRSGATTDWVCPRRRYWNYEYLGRGINPPETQYELYLGTIIHDGIAAMVHSVDIEDIVLAGTKQLRTKLLEGRELDSDAQFLAEEQCALAEGLLRGFHKAVWPRLCADYPEVVLCEQELIYDYEINGQKLRFLAKPDLVRRDKDGNLWYFEWKTTSSNKEEWIHQWETAVQLHSSVKAVEAHLNEPVTGVIVQGFYKSYVSQWGRLESLFCYGYHHPGNPPWEKPKWAYEYKAGLKKHAIWQRDGGVKKWVDEMPFALLASQFPQTPPIFVNEQMVSAFFKQQGMRELQIREARKQLIDPVLHTEAGRQQILDEAFPQHFESCNAWNRPCGYKRLCFGADVDPLTIGYELRHSHHQMEQDSFGAEDAQQ